MRRYLWVVENGNGECLGEARIGDDSERRCHGHCQRLCHLLFFDLCKFSTIAITVAIALSISSPHYFESQSPFLTQFARYTFGLVYTFRPRSTLDLICPLKTGSCFSYFTLCYSHPPHYMKSLFDNELGHLNLNGDCFTTSCEFEVLPIPNHNPQWGRLSRREPVLGH